MDQTIREIESQIDATRRRLGSNLKELEQKVDTATDWREYYRARPFVALSIACAGGLAVSAALRRRSFRSPSRAASLERHSPGRVDPHGQIHELWDNLQAALLGVAAARVKDYVGRAVPGFEEHYRRAQERRTAGEPMASRTHTRA